MDERKKDRMQLLVRRVFLVIVDAIILNASVALALVMRFNISIAAIEPQYVHSFLVNIIPYTLVSLVIFWAFKLYHSLWQYASIAEVYKIVEACFVVEVAHVTFTLLTDTMLPRSVYFNTLVFLIVAESASRFMYRMIRTVLNRKRQIGEYTRIMLIGRGRCIRRMKLPKAPRLSVRRPSEGRSG